VKNEKIDEFRGKYYFLSNFYPNASTVFEKVEYSSSECAYQAAKTKNKEIRILFTDMTPKESKSFWHKKENQKYFREDWNDEYKLKVMKEVVKSKFEKNLFLRIKLVMTKEKLLIEGNYWKDTFWGICDGIGKNYLGKILMEVREEFKPSLLKFISKK
jgi:ribA/ribD-fused uncharacterized protein